MQCFSPLQGYWSKHLEPSGKRRVVFSPEKGFIDRPIEIPCGQCRGCRVNKQQQWGVRCAHEAMLHDQNYFATLTYSDENLPSDLSVSVEAHQLFMKRLRKNTGQKIRFFMCGEYGDKTNRPHYHYLLFGLNLNDLEYWRKGTSRWKGLTYPIYRSLTLERAWPYGFVELGEVNIQSANYVAGYVRKKITGKAADKVNDQGLKPYELYDDKSGEVIKRLPEFSQMSRMPGIGHGFYEKYGDQIRRNDFVIIDGKRMRVPKYYDRLTNDIDSGLMDRLVRTRRIKARAHKANQTPERLRARESYLQAVTSKTKGEL